MMLGEDHWALGGRVAASPAVPGPVRSIQAAIAAPLPSTATSGSPAAVVDSALGADHAPRAGRVAVSTTPPAGVGQRNQPATTSPVRVTASCGDSEAPSDTLKALGGRNAKG